MLKVCLITSFFCVVTIQPENSDYRNVKIDTLVDSILKCCEDCSEDWPQLIKVELNISAEVFMQQIVCTTVPAV